MLALVELFGRIIIRQIEEVGRVSLFMIETIRCSVTPPFRIRLTIKQMEFVGVKSLSVVALTGTFTGMVLALQTHYGFKQFRAEGLVGATVALSMTRELGPVLMSLMVTARAGSAMAAELGTMKVTEQIDALMVMAIDPIRYLVVPRIVAAVLMAPILCAISDFVGIVGGYFVGVRLLGVNSGVYMENTIKYMSFSDIRSGLIKSACFGLILSSIGCYKGYGTRGGAQGVGRATTEAVVLASVLILISDYFLTALMFN